jgi:flagellar basal-body rod modification protein FlgD
MAAAIMNHHLTAEQALTDKTTSSMATGSESNDSSASSDSATITANDFLTLLVTEMQNQDPTADVDPNEYINQLVNVNSLEQLISINQTLTTDSGSSTATSGSSNAAQAQTSIHGVAKQASALAASNSSATTVPGAINAAAAKLAPGNLAIPATNPSALRVAQAMNGEPQ